MEVATPNSISSKPLKKYRIGATFYLAVFSFVVPVIIVEICLRLFAPVPAFTDLYWTGDGRISGRFLPNQVFQTGPGHNPQIVNRKNSYTCRINRFGFRGDDYKIGRNEDSVRIISFGGSSTFNYHDRDEDTWPQRIARCMESHFNKQTELINLSLPGFNAEHAKFNYLAYGRQFKPDIIILYNTWNDLREMARIQGKPDRLTYRAPTSGKKTALKRFLRQFQIARRLRLFYWGFLDSQRYNALLEGDVIENPWYPDDKSWDWFRQNFVDLANFASLDNVVLVLASQGSLISKENIGNLEITKNIMTNMINMPIDDLCNVHAKASQTIKTVAKTHGAVFVDVYNKVPHTLTNFEDHVHISPLGQRAVAEAFCSVLVRNDRIQNVYALSNAQPIIK